MREFTVKVPRLPLWAWIAAGVCSYIIIAGAEHGVLWEQCHTRSIVEFRDPVFAERYCNGNPALVLSGLLWPVSKLWRLGLAISSSNW